MKYDQTDLLPPSYLTLYKYLLVMSEHQILKLRNIAIGLASMNVFSEEEIHVLETLLILQQNR
jgi:hypothetical protein